MSWSIILTADREITLKDAVSIVGTLPYILHNDLSNVYQTDWGWSAATDIDFPRDNKWRISGAGYFSRQVAVTMAVYLAEQLKLRGYSVTIGEMT